MPRFVAVYTMKPEDVVAFRALPKSEQEAIDMAGFKAWMEWSERNTAAIVATDVMVSKTKRVNKSGVADAQNQIAGFVIVEAADITAGRPPLPGPPALHRLPPRRHRRHARRHGATRGPAAMKQATTRAAANWRRLYAMPVASVYPAYIAKAERKGRTRAEVDEIFRWLTGHSQTSLEAELASKTSFEDFFAHAPKMNPSRSLITGVVCGVRVEEIEEPMMREIRYLDKLIDELAKGKAMAKILRT